MADQFGIYLTTAQIKFLKDQVRCRSDFSCRGLMFLSRHKLRLGKIIAAIPTACLDLLLIKRQSAHFTIIRVLDGKQLLDVADRLIGRRQHCFRMRVFHFHDLLKGLLLVRRQLGRRRGRLLSLFATLRRQIIKLFLKYKDNPLVEWKESIKKVALAHGYEINDRVTFEEQ